MVPPPHQEPFWSELDGSIPQDIFPDAIDYPSLTYSESHLLWWTTFTTPSLMAFSYFLVGHEAMSNSRCGMSHLPMTRLPQLPR